MPSDAALNLSFFELLQALNEKLALECTKVRGVRFPPVGGLKVEASAPSPNFLKWKGYQSDGQPFRLNVSKPEYTKSWYQFRR